MNESQTGLLTMYGIFNPENDMPVGYAYSIWKNGVASEPTILSLNGGDIDPNTYRIMPIERRLVIVPDPKWKM